jgi:hypothetical protein
MLFFSRSAKTRGSIEFCSTEKEDWQKSENEALTNKRKLDHAKR